MVIAVERVQPESSLISRLEGDPKNKSCLKPPPFGLLYVPSPHVNISQHLSTNLFTLFSLIGQFAQHLLRLAEEKTRYLRTMDTALHRHSAKSLMP